MLLRELARHEGPVRLSLGRRFARSPCAPALRRSLVSLLSTLVGTGGDGGCWFERRDPAIVLDLPRGYSPQRTRAPAPRAPALLFVCAFHRNAGEPFRSCPILKNPANPSRVFRRAAHARTLPNGWLCAQFAALRPLASIVVTIISSCRATNATPRGLIEEKDSEISAASRKLSREGNIEPPSATPPANRDRACAARVRRSTIQPGPLPTFIGGPAVTAISAASHAPAIRRVGRPERTFPGSKRCWPMLCRGTVS